ncbi:MAG TPA: hypothetical protein VGG84_11050, partial [Gemmatimonadaceae bacterium]
MADDAQPLHGAHDPDRDVVARLIDEARPRPAILPPTREEVDSALRRVLARRDRHDSLDIAVIPIDRYRGRTR